MAVNEAEILDVALQLLDAGGSGAASIRRISAALDSPPNAVYRYFPDQASVFDALLERLLGEIDHAAVNAEERTWRQRVEVLAGELRKALSGHPAVVWLLFAARLDGPNARILAERLYGLMAEAGLEDDQQQRAALLLKAYLLGALALSAGAEQYLWGLRRVLGGLTMPDLK